MRIFTSKPPRRNAVACLAELCQPSVIGLAFVTFTTIFFPCLASKSYGDPGFSCSANGDPLLPWQSSILFNKYWSPGSFFGIALGFGTFTFAQAKAIDLCWDTVVRRGGQMLALALGYSTMRKSMILYMEQYDAHIPLLTAVTFEGISIRTFWLFIRTYWVALRRCNGSGMFCRLLLGFVVVAFYVVVFPTICSAMTGYQTQSIPYYSKLGTGDLTPSTALTKVDVLVVQDGSRIDMINGTIVDDRDSQHDTFSILLAYQSYVKNVEENVIPIGPGQISTHIGQNFTLDYTNSSTKHGNKYVFKPVVLGSTITINQHEWQLQSPPLQIVSSTGYQDEDGVIFNRTWLKDNSTCEPLKTYQWGFSSPLLFIFCLMTIVFTGTLFMMSHTNFWHSRASRFSQDFSVYRDILDLAEELRTELGEKALLLPANELERVVRIKTGSVRVQTDDLRLSRQEEYLRRSHARRFSIFGWTGWTEEAAFPDRLLADSVPVKMQDGAALWKSTYLEVPSTLGRLPRS